MSTNTKQKWDPNDPHGFHASHGGSGGHDEHGVHHVVPALTNRSVLVILLFFTVLTVAFSQFEKSLGDMLMITIPHWANVGVAMFIALIKGVLVVLFFMHIKYDNKLNAIVLVACVLGLILFIGVTMLDLGKRKTVYDFKAAPVVAGGTQYKVEGSQIDALLGMTRSNIPIVTYAKERYIKEQGVRAFIADHTHLTEEATKNLNLTKWLRDNEASSSPVDIDWAWVQTHGTEIWQHEFDLHHAHAGHAPADAHANSANQTRPAHGLTPGLFDADAPPAGSHDGPATDSHDTGH